MAVISTIQINTSQATKSINELEKNLARINEDLKKVDVNSDAFKELKKQAADAKLELDNINKSIESSALGLEDMTHNMADAANAIMGGFTAAQGALNLFGVESEEVVKSIQKLQSLMAISQGIDQIAKGITAFKKLATAIKASSAAQKIFNTYKELQAKFTKQTTVATTAETAAMKTYSTATKTATVATNIFNKALMAVKIIAIITAVTALVAALVKFVNYLKESNNEAEELQKKLKETAKVINQYQTNINKTISELDKLYDRTNELNWEFDKQFTELNKLNLTFDEYIKRLTKAEKVQGLLARLQYSNNNSDFASDFATNTTDITSQISLISEKATASLDEFTLDFVNNINFYTRQVSTIMDNITDEFKNEFTEETTENIMDQLRSLNNYTSTLQQNIKAIQADIKFKEVFAIQPDEVKENWKLLNDALANYSKSVADYTNDTITTLDNVIKKQQEIQKLELQRKQNELAIRKANIDFEASEDKYYKESSKYYEDLIAYYEDLLEIQQKGTAEYNNTCNAIKHIIPLLSEVRAAEELSKLDKNTNIYKPEEEEEEIDNEEIQKWAEEELAKIKEEKAAAADFYENLMNMRASDTYLFMQEQDAQSAYLDECLKKQLLSYEQYTTAKKELDKQAKDYQAKMASQGLSISADILSSLADTMDETNEKQFKAQKAMQISSATISVIAGVIDALTGKFTARATPADWVLAIMQATSIAAAGGAQIAQIARTKYSGSETSTSTGAIAATLSTPTQISSAVQNANIEAAVTDTRVYVLESDIKKTSNKVNVQEQENRY